MISPSSPSVSALLLLVVHCCFFSSSFGLSHGVGIRLVADGEEGGGKEFYGHTDTWNDDIQGEEPRFEILILITELSKGEEPQ